MAWTGYQIALCFLMVTTGTINSLSAKWADTLKAKGSDGKYERTFNHPFFQVFCMFIGEVTCMIGFKILLRYYQKKGDNSDDQLPSIVSGNRNFSPLIFVVPTICDLTSTSLMNTGLILTDVSSFQMLRGSLIVFTAFFAVGFLNKKIKVYEIIGIAFAIAGLVVVGVSDAINPKKKSSGFGPNGVITGDLLIILGQVMTATQFIIEEKFVVSKKISPLQAVGWEGIFGCLIVGFLFIPLYFIQGGDIFFTNPNGSVEDVYDALIQVGNNKYILIALIGYMSSIAFFNFAGVSITQELSAPTRSVLDTIRTLTIKIVAVNIADFDERFDMIQFAGFVLLAIGILVYNDVIRAVLKKAGFMKDPPSYVEATQDINEEEESIVSQVVG